MQVLKPCTFEVMLACYLAGCLSPQFRRFLRHTFLHVGRARDEKRPGRPGSLEKSPSPSPPPSPEDCQLRSFGSGAGSGRSHCACREVPAVQKPSSAVHCAMAMCNSEKPNADESWEDSKPGLVMRDSDRAVLLKPAGWEVYGQHAACTWYILRTSGCGVFQ